MTKQHDIYGEAAQVADKVKKRSGGQKNGAGDPSERSSDTPADAPYRNDPRHVTPFAIPIEALDITPQQIKFVEAYLVSSNGKEAAIAAGYSEDSAKEQASRLLTYANVEAYMRARLSQTIQALAINPEFIQAELLDTYRKAKEPIPIYDREGNFTGEYQFDGRTAVAALGLLAKIRGMLDKVDGRSQITAHVAITIGQYNPQAAQRLCEAVGIEVPREGVLPRVEGFPRSAPYQFRSPKVIDQKPDGEA